MEAVNGNSSIKLLQKAYEKNETFDLVLMDYHLPVMNGEMIIREIKKNKNIKNIPIILITSLPLRGDAKLMTNSGIQGYLTKPVKQKSLLNAISLILNPERKKKQDEVLVTRHTINQINRYKVDILLVEDNAINQKLTTKLLENMGYHCDIAVNGIEAVDAVKKRNYDIILMDCQMPVMNGFEATKKIRELESGPKPIHIIALTAFDINTVKEECDLAGMDDYVSKPIKKNILLEKLEYALNPK